MNPQDFERLRVAGIRYIQQNDPIIQEFNEATADLGGLKLRKDSFHFFTEVFDTILQIRPYGGRWFFRIIATNIKRRYDVAPLSLSNVDRDFQNKKECFDWVIEIVNLHK